MIAGTLGQLEASVKDPLETTFTNGQYPALDVESTQTSFDNRPIQAGLAADRTTTVEQRVEITTDADGKDRSLTTQRMVSRETVLTEWVADVTGTGLVAAASVGGPGPLAFPFDLVYFQTDERVERLRIDIGSVYTDWQAQNAVGDVWMTGSDHGDGARMGYHEQTDTDAAPTIGLGFERPWQGTVVRGVVYQSGYVALYSVESATKFVRFCGDELLPHAHPVDADENQQTLGDDACDRCGRETMVVDYDGGQYCPICVDYFEDGDVGGEADDGQD